MNLELMEVSVELLYRLTYLGIITVAMLSVILGYIIVKELKRRQ